MSTSNRQFLLIYRINLPSKNSSILAFTLSTFFANSRRTRGDLLARLECDRRSSRSSLRLAGSCPKNSRERRRTCSRTSLTCLRPFVETPCGITTML